MNDIPNFSQTLSRKNKGMAAQIKRYCCSVGYIKADHPRRTVASSARLEDSCGSVASPSVESGASASITTALYNDVTNGT